MARYQCPSTPFSTPLSGSARQAEARIRNLFQGPKRRPPVWLMVLVLLLILSCGGLVACQEPGGSAAGRGLRPDRGA